LTLQQHIFCSTILLWLIHGELVQFRSCTTAVVLDRRD
jgi:hypothetical protein